MSLQSNVYAGFPERLSYGLRGKVLADKKIPLKPTFVAERNRILLFYLLIIRR